jgi:MoaA/NifB/PqqE/SkfB family radical SAM enzyme
VKISWNGATAATAEAIMGGLRFAQALAGVTELVRARDAARARGARACTVSFQVTAQEANVEELPAIVRLAARLGVDRVKVNQLQVHRAALAAEDLRRSPASRARWNRAVEGARAAAAGTPLRLENLVELDEGGREPPRGPCPFLGREAWIAADGAFLPCPAPAAADGAFGDLGSVAAAPLGESWAGAAYRRLVAEYEDHPACARCALRRPGGA